MKFPTLIFISFCFLFPVLSQAQCPAGTDTSSVNLVVNGDFEAGNVNFTSDYTYCNSANCLQPEAMYAVGSNPTFYHSAFVGADHTTGLGNLMVVNGAGTPNTNVWCQTITVTPNTQYLFSTWVSSMVANSPAILQFSINGVQLGTAFTAPGFINFWQEFNDSWYSGVTTSAAICIVNQNTNLGGNDFGLDDITFTPCVCNFVFNAGGDTQVCNGGGYQFQLSNSNTYTWFPATGLSCTNCNNPIASPTVTTTYTIDASLSFCPAIDSVVVTVNPVPTVTASGDTSICSGEQTTIHAFGNGSYSWSPTTGLSATNIANPIASPTSTTSYTVTVTNLFGCAASDIVVVSITQTANVSAGVDNGFCDGGQVQLNATGGGNYSWSPSNGLSATNIFNPIASPAQTTTYTVTVTGSSNCTGSDDVVITVHPFPVAEAGGDVVYCAGHAVQLNASGASDYQWSPGAGLSSSSLSNPFASPNQTTTYTVTVSTPFGCTDTASVIVTYDNFILSGIIDTLICPATSIQLFANGCGDCDYNWSPSTALSDNAVFNPNASPGTSTVYAVTVTDALGCTNSFSTSILVDPTCYILTMPTAFSPNADGSNDYFHPLGKGVKTIEWSVFNRWGEVIYSSHNFYDKWNGAFKGEVQPIGVYAWKLNATMENGELISKEGNVTLLK